jgi:hypothetical protein
MRKKKENKKLNIIMAVFIAVLMVGSIAGYMWTGNNESLNYKEYNFKVKGEQLTTEINNQNYYFYYHPTDLISLNVSEQAKQALINSELIYVTFDPYTEDIVYVEQARFDLTNEFLKTGKAMINGQSKDSEYDLPLIDCNNATEFIPVIYFRAGNKTEIYNEGNCIIAEASFEQAFIALKDRIMYTILGILE